MKKNFSMNSLKPQVRNSFDKRMYSYSDILNELQVRPDPVKTKVLELIQCWSHAFRNEGSYKIVQDTFQLMKLEGMLCKLIGMLCR